jgi:hypothetical protein
MAVPLTKMKVEIETAFRGKAVFWKDMPSRNISPNSEVKIVSLS